MVVSVEGTALSPGAEGSSNFWSAAALPFLGCIDFATGVLAGEDMPTEAGSLTPDFVGDAT